MRGGPAIIHLASGNPHKVQELSAFAKATAGRRRPIEFVLPERMPGVEEDTGTFVGNAQKKAAALQALLPPDAWVLADDSGVCVEALGGAPGVESAYYAGPQHDAAANLLKLTEVMRDVPEGRREAFFFCVLVLRGPGGVEHVFEGRCDGVLARVPAGGAGFGYDPLFIPAGYDRTYAQLSEAEKNKISHRGQAWLRLAQYLDRYFETAIRS